MKIELATIDRNKILNGKTQMIRVNTILQQLGFRLIEQQSHATSALYALPQWYRDQTGAINTYYNKRQLCVDAMIAWDKYVNRSVVTTEIAPEPENQEILLTLTTTVYSPMTISAITATVKVVNVTGKYEIVESSDIDSVPVGKTYNSTIIVHKDLGSVWAITCHLTDKGSIKIDSITEPIITAPVIIPVTSVAPVIAAISGSVTIIETPEPVKQQTQTDQTQTDSKLSPDAPRVLTANIDEWLCSDYYISPDARMAFKTIYSFLQHNPRVSGKVLMTGDPGYGKTTIAERFAAFVGLDCYRMNCAIIRDPSEWFFDQEVKSKIVTMPDGSFGVVPETVFTVSEFSQRVARGNCVIILDEFNRLESNMHNTLFPLLDDAGKTTLHHIEFTVGPNVIFVATVNLGAASVGTFLLDDALTNRFDILLPVKPMPFDHECAILRARFNISEPNSEIIVKMATIIRENDLGVGCSTRDTLKIARMVSVGLEIRHAYEYVVVQRVPDDESNAPVRKSLVDLINKEIGTRGSEFALIS